MPYALQTVPETRETIIRPVVYNVIDQLEILTTISRDIRVLFPGQAEVSYQIGSQVDADPSAPTNTFLSQGQLSVKVDDNFVEDRVINTAVTQRQNNPIFGDAELGVDIRPIYSFNELVLNFTYRAPDQSTARKFRNDLKMRRTMGRVENLHEIAYSYGVPFEFFSILGELYTLREKQAGYNDTFNNWFNAHVTKKATVVTNMAGKQPIVVIREQQIGVLGWFDALVTVDEPERSNDAGAYDVNFTYHVQFDKPLACLMRYPIVVHNQLVPQDYLVDNTIYQLRNRVRAPAWTRFLFDQFTPLYRPVSVLDGVQTPVYDDWRPSQVYPDTSSLITMMMQVDPNDPTDLCSLTDLGAYLIDPDILNFLKTEYPYLTEYRASVVNIELYENNSHMGYKALNVDDQLHVSTTFAMDLRKTYHLRMSLVNDLLSLPQDVQDRLRLNGVACLKILATLEANLPGGVQLPTLVGGQIVSRADFLAAAQRINSQKVPLKSNLEYVFLATVGNFLIATGRES